MNFLAPAAFAFLAALPVVILFYLLKRKRVVKLVPSTLLWQKFLAETQASAPFQKLKHNWLLFLQLLLLILAILAIARPYFAGKTTGGRILVAVLDASASMQARDEDPSRFEKARKQALALVDSLHTDDQMVVLQAGATTHVMQSPTSEKSALRRAINEARVSDSPTRLNEALKLAQTLIQNSIKAEIHLFSDGATPSLDEFENQALPLVYHKVGQRGVNVGVVNLDVRANPDNPAQRAVFATIQNASTNAQSVQAELLFEDQVLEVKNVSMGPKEAVPLVFIASQAKDGVFTVRIESKDDLLVDDRASVVSLLPQPLKVLLVSPGNRFLEKALKAVPAVELSTAPVLTDAAEGFDLVVLDNVVPLTWPAGNVFAFHIASTNLFEGWSTVEAPPIVDWKSGHPLLRFVNFDNVQIVETLGVKAPSWGVPLVESPNTPLIMAGQVNNSKIVWVGFDALQSTWPLRISFPIFVANTLDWLNPATERASQLTVRAGEPFRMKVAEVAGPAQITMPDGTKLTRELDAVRKEILFGDTYQQGVYRVQVGTNSVAFAVNLLDAAETDVHPRDELRLGQYAKVASGTERQANLELWRWFALTALLILLFEWWYYHKRTA